MRLNSSTSKKRSDLKRNRTLARIGAFATTGLFIAWVLGFSGCENNDVKPADDHVGMVAIERPTPTDSTANVSRPTQFDSPSAANLALGDEKTLSDWLIMSRGQVVLIDFWATWCGPCVQQFPHTVELAKRHRDQGLAVFAVSMDEPDDQSTVADFLTRQKADFQTLLTRYGAGAEFVNAFQLRGDIPFYRLYDRQGQLRFSFSADPEGMENCETIENMDQRINELLAEAN